MNLNTWGLFASLIRTAIAIATLVIKIVEKVTSNRQKSHAFDKRTPTHLKQIGLLLKEFNSLLPNISENVIQVNNYLALLKSEIQSLLNKITDRRVQRLIQGSISRIEENLCKQFILKQTNANSNGFKQIINIITKVNEAHYQRTYTELVTVYGTVNNLYKDKRINIKNNI